MFGDVVVFLIHRRFVAGSISKIVRDKKKGSKMRRVPAEQNLCLQKSRRGPVPPMRQAADPNKGEGLAAPSAGGFLHNGAHPCGLKYEGVKKGEST